MWFSLLFDDYAINPLLLSGWECAALAFAIAGGWLLWIWRLKSSLSAEQQLRITAEQERDDAIRSEWETTAERQTIRWQSDLSRSLLPHRPPERALSLFLKSLAPNTRTEFAALIRRDEAGVEILLKRGNADAALDWDKLPLTPPESWRVHFAERQVSLIPTGSEYQIVTSQIGATSASESVRREAILEVLPAVAERAAAYCGTSAEQSELGRTAAMLKLREAAEVVRRAGSAEITQYLESVAATLGAKRVSVFLRDVDAIGSAYRRLASFGWHKQRGLDSALLEHELAVLASDPREQCEYNADQLKRLKVSSVVDRITVVPLNDRDRAAGYLVVSYNAKTAIDAASVPSSDWLANHTLELLRQLREQFSMERQATRDSLTGLANRAAFDHTLAESIAAATPESPTSLVLLDLDHFKAVNDEFGHAAGDAALEHVATLMRQAAGRMRASDSVLLARYGGEELAVVMNVAGLGAGLRLAEQIRKAVATTPFRFQDRAIPLSLSAGVASCPEHGTEPVSLIQAADTALYASKRLGRNRVTDSSDTASLDALKATIRSNSTDS